MKLIHDLELQNFKTFGATQRIELDHPGVLIGPNNCGKTSAIQAIALWSQAIQTWIDVRRESTARERTATALNRLAIVSVPVRRTRFFWHDTKVRTGNKDIHLTISVSIEFEGKVVPVKMRFRNQGEDLVYCTPDETVIENIALLEAAASLNVHMLYPMSGLETEEPIVQPGRIDVLLGQGQTAQVLRNLCLIVHQQSPEDWKQITLFMKRLFSVDLETPEETARGAISLRYRQPGVKEFLDLSLSGRGFQQLLLIFAYLYSHKGSILLINEPDAHLEILRQKQVYVLLRDIASKNGSQVILVTHSEVVLEEALDTNVTLLLNGKADNLAKKSTIKNSLKLHGAAHYVKARQCGYAIYVEGRTDLDILKAFAEKAGHPVAESWDPKINSYYTQDNFPEQTPESELERVEGGFGLNPKQHFFKLREMFPELKGLTILDSDGQRREAKNSEGLSIDWWSRYEVENYFITPELLKSYAETTLISGHQAEITQALNEVTLEFVFEGNQADFETWDHADEDAATLIWNAKTKTLKLSRYGDLFFSRLADLLGAQIMLSKGEYHRLIDHLEPEHIDAEVIEKLDLISKLFSNSN